MWRGEETGFQKLPLLGWWIALDRGGVCLVTPCAKVVLTAEWL